MNVFAVLKECKESGDEDPEISAGLEKRISKIKLQIAASLKEDIKFTLATEEKENTKPTNAKRPAGGETDGKANPKKRPASSETPDVDEVAKPKKVRKVSGLTSDVDQMITNELSAKIVRSNIVPPPFCPPADFVTRSEQR